MNPQSIKLACILKGLKVRPQEDFAAKGTNQGKSARAFSGLLKQASTSAKDILSPAAHKATKRPNTGQGWVEHFRNQLLSQGIPFKDLSLSPKALPELKELLIGEGFSKRQVDRFLERLFGGNANGEIKITQLFEKLSELKALSEKKSRDPVLVASALPHLETALRSFGLDVQQGKRLIDQARADGGGLNLKTFVQKLKQLLSRLPQGIRPSFTGSAEEIRGMLARIGFADEAGEVKGPISLERFVEIVEETLARLQPDRLPKGQMENHANRLLGHVRKSAQTQGSQAATGKGIQAMASTGNQKSVPAQCSKVSFGKGAQEMLSTGDPAEEPTAAHTKAARFPVEVEKMLRGLRGSSDQKGVDQGAETALCSATGATTDRPHATGQTARTLPRYIVNQVGRQMALGVRRGESQIRLQLKPPHLGSVELNIDMKDNVLKVGMITEHHSVKELLMSHVHELRESLLEQGLKFERIDIQIHYNFGQSMANARRDLNEMHSRRQNLSGPSPISGSEQEILEEVALANMQSNALLDMFA